MQIKQIAIITEDKIIILENGQFRHKHLST